MSKTANLCFYIGRGAQKEYEEMRDRASGNALVFDRTQHTSELCGACDRALHGFADFVTKASAVSVQDVLIAELIECLDEARAGEAAACLLPLLQAGKNVRVFVDLPSALVLPFVREMIRFMGEEGYTGDVHEIKQLCGKTQEF